MEEAILHVGIPGIFAILILREVIPFVSRKVNGKGKLVTQDVCDEIQKRRDVQLSALGKACDRIDGKVEKGFNEVKELIESKHRT